MSKQMFPWASTLGWKQGVSNRTPGALKGYSEVNLRDRRYVQPSYAVPSAPCTQAQGKAQDQATNVNCACSLTEAHHVTQLRTASNGWEKTRGENTQAALNSSGVMAPPTHVDGAHPVKQRVARREGGHAVATAGHQAHELLLQALGHRAGVQRASSIWSATLLRAGCCSGC